MIVAHPDDELLWGWKELEHAESWTIICLTNSNVLQRAYAFATLTEMVNAKGFMYNYPDNPSHLRWDTDTQRNICDDLRSHLRSPNITRILTHGPKGEYGHYHHRMTSELVTNVCASIGKLDKLEYFAFDPAHIKPHTDHFMKCLSLYFTPKEISTNCIIQGHLALSRMVYTRPSHSDDTGFNVYRYYPPDFKTFGSNSVQSMYDGPQLRDS